MTLQFWQYIGAGNSTTGILLYCQITSITKDIIKAWVINGNWEVEFHSSGDTFCLTLDEKIDCQILFTDIIPKNYPIDQFCDYTSFAISYMRVHHTQLSFDFTSKIVDPIETNEWKDTF